MTGVLERVARASPATSRNQFLPTNPLEFFALRLAQKLGDAYAAKHYVELAERYSEGPLLTAYRRAKRNGSQADPSRSFHVELKRLGDRNTNAVSHRRLAAIRIARRSVAVAILSGDHLEYPPVVRQLPTASDKALVTIELFIKWILERCPFETAALEVVPITAEVQRTALTEAVHRILAAEGISIWKVSKLEMIQSFGYPSPRFRREVREIVSNIWPGLNGSSAAPLIQDALALGLYCQTEYLFNL